MKDKIICPNCGEGLDVEVYGFGLECSECHQLLDVFPDKAIVVHTPFGKVVVELPSILKFFGG